jgi:hypothetical protein
MFWRWLVTGPACGVAQPVDGTAAPVATGAVVAAVTPPSAVLAVGEVEQPALTPTTSIATAVMATVRLWALARMRASEAHRGWWG